MTDPAAATDASDAAAQESPHTWRPARFMLIAAHPDDADFGPAATAASWIDQGSVGWLVCCTSGDAGAEDENTDPLELAALREREQRAAADIVGYEGVTFLHHPDGALENNLILREQLVREIRTFKPDAIIAMDPQALFHNDRGVNHTDHRAAGMAAVDAAYPAARNPMAFPWLAREGLRPHRVRRLYLTWTNTPTVRIDVSKTLDRKFAALRAHASQLHDPERVEQWVRQWTAEEGAKIGTAAADVFHLVIIDDDDEVSEEQTALEASPEKAD
jgi:LmbE family N-acetylglucosaminyl deacetylase